MSAHRYRSKPVEIEALQWLGFVDPVADFIRTHGGRGGWPSVSDQTLWVEKSKRWCECPIGTWIVPEPDGDGFYPVAPEVFAAHWEPVEAKPMFEGEIEAKPMFEGEIEDIRAWWFSGPSREGPPERATRDIARLLLEIKRLRELPKGNAAEAQCDSLEAAATAARHLLLDALAELGA